MPLTGQCTNYTGCTLAARNELFTIPDGTAFVCPECGLPLTQSDFLTSKGRTIFPLLIVGGIALLAVMGAGGVYLAVQKMRQPAAAGQIGTSFEQGEIAAAKGEIPGPGKAPEATPAPVIAYTQFSPGDTLELVQTQLQLNNEQVRYRGGMPDDKMSMVYFLSNGNLHIDVTRNGDTWVLLTMPVLEQSDASIQDRVNAWDNGADAQALKARRDQ